MSPSVGTAAAQSTLLPTNILKAKPVRLTAYVGIAPTGKPVRVPGMEVNRIANGKIVEIWRLSDTMSLMQQIGAV